MKIAFQPAHFAQPVLLQKSHQPHFDANILLVEDNIQLGSSYQEILYLEGHNVTWAKNASEGFQKLGEDIQFDGVISDRDMPDPNAPDQNQPRNGLDVLRQAANYGIKHLLLVSAGDSVNPHEQPANQVEMLNQELGREGNEAIGFMPKPFDIPDLVDLVGSWS